MIIRNYEEVIEKLKTKLIDYLEEKGINTKTNFQCLSPDHEDNHASMGVVPQSGYTKAHCFACGAFIDIFDAVTLFDKKPKNGPEYIEKTVMWLANKYQINVELKELTEEEKYRIDVFNAYKEAANYIAGHASNAAILDMQRRGWNVDQCRERLIGGVPSFEEYKNHMKSQKFQVSFMENIDLLNSNIFNENALIFTICDSYGRPCGFSSRNLVFDKESNDPKLNRKYNNTSAKCPIYEKSKRLYNIHNTKIERGTIYLTEGCADTEGMLQKGVLNTIGIGGTSFTEYHVIELAKSGRTDITILTDGDAKGIEAIDRIIEKFSSHRDFSIYVIALPDAYDPDEFMQEKGLAEFKKLKRWTAFEWKLQTYDDRIETALIRKEIIPIIATEPSPIEREKMIEILSHKIEVTVNAIREEVQQLLDANEQKRKKEQDAVLNNLIADLRNSPTNWKYVIGQAQQELEQLGQKYNDDTFNPNIYIKEIESIKMEQETPEETGMTCNFWKWPEFQSAIDGNHESTLNVIGGSANCGKTAWMCNAAYQLASIPDTYGVDYFVIFHTIDDTLKQFTTRMICQFAQERFAQITLNMINKPNKFKQAKLINEAREYAYAKYFDLIKRQKILIKGGEEGGGASLTYAREMLRYAKKIRPEATPVYFLDNFHRLRDFSGEKDERVKFKKLSGATKDMAKEFGIPIWATMEYNKSVGVGRPTNNSISESIAMEYDANLIMHLYNDMHVKNQLGEEPDVFFTRVDERGMRYKAPRIEAIVGKNKLNSFKGSLYFDFHSDQSRMVPVDSIQVKRDMELAIAEKKEAGCNTIYRNSKDQ